MILLNGEKINIGKFPDGTPNINFNRDNTMPFAKNREGVHDFDITWKFDNMAELFVIQCLVDWLNSHDQYVQDLYMPYIPNARMDRVKDESDVFTLKTFAKVINDMKFDQVYVKNAHSNVALALIDNVVDDGCELDIQKVLLNILKTTDASGDNFTLFFPDEGATKRYCDYDTVKSYPVATGMKKRDWQTGKILGLDVIGKEEDIKGKDILIIDDICSKGGTFYYSARKLKEMGANRIYLYITHCENCIDWEKLQEAGIEHVYTTDSIYRAPESVYATDACNTQNKFISVLA